MAATSELSQAIDALFQEAFSAHGPGAAVIAVKDGAVLFRKGYGLANIELGVPVEPDMVFRLGSITKQFTGVAILMLAEEGLLALDDPITRFLPDYPTHAHTITVEHLLTHTSGIKSYTSMPEWRPLWRKDFAVHELIDFFKYQPMEFAPGTRFNYNNSGYHLLGAIIEKVSGKTYEQFLQERIFEPLGMRQSYYDTPTRIIPRRVAGYDQGPNGYSNAEYLSMTQPYAAGSLGSTVDDLALWDAALYTGRLLKPELLKQAWSSYQLADGTPVHYGYGWAIRSWQGSPTLEHGGGIHGFSTFAIRMPEERAFVAVLTNSGSAGPELFALKTAALVIGKPFNMPVQIALTDAQLDACVGIYQTPHDATWQITRDGNQLKAQRTNGPIEILVPISADECMIQGMELHRIVFTYEPDGSVNGIEFRGREELIEVGKRVEQTPVT